MKRRTTTRDARRPPRSRRRAGSEKAGPMPYYRCTACGLTSYSAASYSTAPSCPACAARLADTAKLHLVPGEDRDLTRTLAARPESVAEARRTLVGLPLPEDSRQE